MDVLILPTRLYNNVKNFSDEIQNNWNRDQLYFYLNLNLPAKR